MAILIPLWYYEFGSVIYLIATFVGLLLSYYSFKLYELGSKKKQMLFHFGFIFITAGLFAMALGNIYGYVNFVSCQPVCQINPSDLTYSIIRFGNYGYYLATLIGYALIALSYMGSARKLLPVVVTVGVSNSTFVLYPFVNAYFQLFHLLSVLIVSYIGLKTIHNYNASKSKYSFYVMLGFIFIGVFHFLMLLIPFSEILYALAHFSMLLGFGSLLYMLIQVNRHERA
jgi:hypothetical protein